MLLLVLIGFMVVGSLVAIETRGLLSSVISVGAVGFALSVVFLLLGAPDLAITQVVVEILVLVVLVRVVITRRDETYATSRSTLAVGSVLLVLGILVAVVFWALGASGGAGLQMRPFGNPLLNEIGPASAMAPASTAGPPAARSRKADAPGWLDRRRLDWASGSCKTRCLPTPLKRQLRPSCLRPCRGLNGYDSPIAARPR